jgi:hypothetical protein
MNRCENITPDEWREIAQLEYVQEGWGLEGDETVEMLADIIHGAKFPNYMTDGPGYAGPVYILLGGDIAPPVILTRNKGALEVADLSWAYR